MTRSTTAIPKRLPNDQARSLKTASGQFQFLRIARNSLGFLHEGANALGIFFGVTVAGERVGAAAGFDQDIRPQEAGLDVDGSHFVDADADFIDAEPGALASNYRPLGDFDARGKKKVALCPTTGLENLGCHKCLAV